MRKTLLAAALVALLAIGVGVAFAVGETTGTVSACASVGAQTIAVNGAPVSTVPGQSNCVTTTYTVPTVTQTVTNTVTVTAPSNPPIFAFDPVGGDLRPWDEVNLGTGDVAVSSDLNGGTSPGTVQVTNSTWGKVIQETATSTAHASPASSTDSVYLWNQTKQGVFVPGQTTWIHYEEIFPGLSDPHPFRPLANAEANPWMLEFHNDGTTYASGAPSSVVAGVFTDAFFGDPAGEKMYLRLRGGAASSDCGWRDWHTYTSGAGCAYVPLIAYPLQRDHVYDVLLGITWSPDPNVGHVTAVVDGVTKYDQNVATLTQTSTGYIDHPNFELNNYRPHDTVDSTVYYRRVKIASTRTDAGF